MIPIKTPQEIEIMREGGDISSRAMKAVLAEVKPGVTLKELDTIAENVITSAGASASFKTVDDYSYATCINVNAGIVHGIPNLYELEEGDVVSIDLGAYYKGFHTDMAFSVEVSSDKEGKFLNAGRKALENAIFNCVEGNRIGDVCHAIQSEIERNGYSVSRDLVGHGVGRQLHEDPYVPGYGKKKKGLKLENGMVLAIEVIYQKGRPEISLDFDGWTYKTADGSLSGLFEHTVAITPQGPQIITEL